MKRYAQIQENKVFYIYEVEERPPFPDDVLLVDVTDKPEVKEGWDYDAKTGEFTAPIIVESPPISPQPTLEEMQAQTLLNTEYLISKSDLLGGM
ncbi:hypothetical protein [Lysinibacillus sp. TE18511]